MIPDPLHPAVVHFPIVFAVLLPLVAAAALWAIRRGTAPRRAWAFPLAIAGALALSAFVAVQSGQAQQERVERVVGERPLESHEETAELFLVLSGVLLVIAGVGLAPGVAGRAARIVAALGAVGLLGAGYRAGASGGDLVYRHGAGSAYSSDVGPSGVPATEPESGERDGGR
jgi:uncharacterized membrane protein